MKAQVQRAQNLLNRKTPKPIEALAVLKPLMKSGTPPWPVYHFAGIAYALLGDHTRCEEAMRAALDGGSTEPETYHTLSVALYKQEKYAEAESFARQVVQMKPDFVKALLNLGLILQAQARLEEALQIYARANQLDPGNAVIAFKIGVIYKNLGNFAKAVELFDIAMKMDPTYEGPVIEKAGSLIKQRDFEKSDELLADFLRRKPNSVEARSLLADSKKEQSLYDEAIVLYKEVLDDNPRNPGVRVNYGLCLQEMGRYDESEKEYLRALDTPPPMMESMSNYLMVMHYNPERTREYIFEAHKKWDAFFAPAERPERPVPADRSPDKRLRVGFVSGGFRSHPVGWMITRGLEELSPEDYEIYCYTTNNINDKITQRIATRADKWRSVVGFNDEVVARLIREDEIDILVELSGHAGDNRLRAVAMEPAPVIVKWVGGLFNSTGLRSIDYLISDWNETPGGVEEFYTEKLVRMPDDYICFMPPSYAPEVSPLPALEQGFVTFGCFNNPSKINPELLSRWGVLLARVPGSKLFLKSGQYDSVEFQERILGALADAGIGRDRVIFEGRSPHEDLLGAYSKVDIALDPWPYSGGLSTCEALWQGVPVVTYPGPTFAGRHSVTHLRNAGLPEMVADSWDEYVDKAAGLAGDLDALAGLRARLRDQVSFSPLCDGERFGAALGDAFRQMWHAYAEDRLRQDHIAVSDAVGREVSVVGNNVPVVGNDVSAGGSDDAAARTSSKVSTAAGKSKEGDGDVSGAAVQDIPKRNMETSSNANSSQKPNETEVASDVHPVGKLQQSMDTTIDDDSIDEQTPNNAAPSDYQSLDGSRPATPSFTEEHPSDLPKDSMDSKTKSTDEEIAKIARYQWKHGSHENLQVEGKHGIKYSVPSSLEVMSTYVLLEQGQWYDPDVDFVAEFVQPGMNVLDIGAGFGAYALPAAQKVGPAGKVYAFEPVGETRKHLDISKVENGFTGLEVVGRALGSASGKRGLSKTATPELTVLEQDGNDVQVVTLDSWWDFEGNPSVDVLKIDVNGKELDVLQGAERMLTEQSPVLILATGNMTQATLDLLQAKTYTFFDYIGGVGVLSPVEDWSQRDSYAQNVVAIKQEQIAALAASGWIHNETADVAEPEMGYWKKSLRAMPWTEELFSEWEKQSIVPGHTNYFRALDYICAAEDLVREVEVLSDTVEMEGSTATEAGDTAVKELATHEETPDTPDKGFTNDAKIESRLLRSHKATLLLVAAQELIAKYNAGEGGASVAMTLVRVMNTLGRRDQAVAIMQKLMQDSKMGQDNMDVALPFLLPIPAMDQAPIRTEFAKWLMVRTVESWLLLKDLTGYLSGETERKLTSLLIGNSESSSFESVSNRVNEPIYKGGTSDLFQTRRYAKAHFGVDGLFHVLNERKIKYVILRWFENLPHIDEGEDLDFLIADEDLYKLSDVFESEPSPGSVKCDIYSVTGKSGSSFEGLPYYESRLAEIILDNSILYKGKYRVPDPLRYLLSLAYHVVFHKADFSGLSVRDGEKPRYLLKQDHNYAVILKNIAKELQLDIEPTLEGLLSFLRKYNFVPSVDLTRKLSIRRPWLRELYPPTTPKDLSSGELAVFVIREWATANGWEGSIIKHLISRGFDIKRIIKLNKSQQEASSKSLRGGNWNKGPWPVSGGKPSVLVVAYDYTPIFSSKKLRKYHPFLSNARVFGIKQEIREAINKKLPKDKRLNPIHTTDDEVEAMDYVLTVGGKALKSDILDSISLGYQGSSDVKIKVHTGSRAETYISYQTGQPAVLKQYFDTNDGNNSFSSELLAISLFNDRKWFPKCIKNGKRWILQEYIPNSLRLDVLVNYLNKEEKRTIAGRILDVIFEIYDSGYAHRDIHAKNIFIVDGNPILIDYETIIKQSKSVDFLKSYDITAKGLISPYNTSNMCWNNRNYSYTLLNTLGVDLEIAQKFSTTAGLSHIHGKIQKNR
ncbi:MAG: FkbM family methyltransferase [Bacteroidetes bacterium HLUCCA01]|nr:MAG: FkbM family methyltransferase [Bacteroidetes bacterium HLUCCA01]